MPGRSVGAAWPRVDMAGGAGGALIVDEATGLPSAIEFPSETRLAPIVCTTSLVVRVGGDEVHALAGGLDYPGAEELSGFTVAAVEIPAPGTGATAPAGALLRHGRRRPCECHRAGRKYPSVAGTDRAVWMVFAPRLPHWRRAAPSSAGI